MENFHGFVWNFWSAEYHTVIWVRPVDNAFGIAAFSQRTLFGNSSKRTIQGIALKETNFLGFFSQS